MAIGAMLRFEDTMSCSAVNLLTVLLRAGLDAGGMFELEYWVRMAAAELIWSPPIVKSL